MRRILIALLAFLITGVFPLATPAGASEPGEPPSTAGLLAPFVLPADLVVSVLQRTPLAEGPAVPKRATAPSLAALPPVPPPVAPSAPVAVPAQAPTPVVPWDGVSDADRAMWERVAQCETGGNWSMTGARYSGGVGFLNASWLAYGGGQYAPLAGEATEDQQITIAKAIQGGSPPDQHGCSGGW